MEPHQRILLQEKKEASLERGKKTSLANGDGESGRGGGFSGKGRIYESGSET